MKRLVRSLVLIGVGLSTGCGSVRETTEPVAAATKEQTPPSIDFEKYTLANGLDVILHVDRSDPVVAINIAAHVGSGRELPGRTGFAHLFEHLLFLDSENLGYGGLDEMNTRIGGDGTNGFTTTDITQYYQAVPADALEKVIWAEADKLGFFINTVTQPVIDNEKQVVKNEKRQRVDNQPYGHNFDVIGKTLYPSDHPYNWQVIGSLADLDAATLDDVKNFYRRWYVPNNVTLTLAGDFEVAEAKRLVEKYFGEIPAGQAIKEQAPRPGVLTQNHSLYHEDNFATVPQLTMVWPTVDEFHPDAYALSILGEYLASGKRAPLNEVLIDERKLTSQVSIFNYGKELAGELYLSIRANAGEDLDQLVPAIAAGFERFERNGIAQADLDRIKAGIEVGFYGQVQSALGKAIQLAEYNTLTGDPDRINQDIRRLQAVTTTDVESAYRRYLKDRPYIATSFVPKGQLELALAGSEKADVVEEKVVQGAESEVAFDPKVRNFERTPSGFDRSIEPPFGKPYTLPKPNIWRDSLANGTKVYGIENNETPLVYFSLAIDAGQERGSVTKPAVANLTADLLEKGTAQRTTAELEDAINSLGSNISISAATSGTFVTGSTLSRNFEQTIVLVEEMLLEPRWDAEEFAILKRRQLNQIDQDAGNPNAIARRELAKLMYPPQHILSYQPYGTKDKLAAVTMDDLKAFHSRFYAPTNSRLRVVGDVDQARVKQAFQGLSARWKTPAPEPVTLAQARAVDQAKLYFYDVPEAKQSVLRIVRPSLAATDRDYALAQAINFLLGGIYTSRLNTELRVNRGYTYGIGSGFRGSKDRGIFAINSSVRTNVTKESLELIRQIVAEYGPGFTDGDLTVLKSALLRGQALTNETLNAKLSMLGNISTYGYPDDYQARDAARIEALTLGEMKTLAAKYMTPDAMNYLIVGDAQSQAERLNELGLGAAVILPVVE